MNLLMMILISIFLDKLVFDIISKDDYILNKKTNFYKNILMCFSLMVSLLISNLLSSTFNIDILSLKYLIFIFVNYIVLFLGSMILKLDDDFYIVTSSINSLVLSFALIEETSFVNIISNSVLILILFLIFTSIIDNIKFRLNEEKIMKCFRNYPVLLIILGIIAILCKRYIF